MTGNSLISSLLFCSNSHYECVALPAELPRRCENPLSIQALASFRSAVVNWNVTFCAVFRLCAVQIWAHEEF